MKKINPWFVWFRWDASSRGVFSGSIRIFRGAHLNPIPLSFPSKRLVTKNIGSITQKSLFQLFHQHSHQHSPASLEVSNKDPVQDITNHHQFNPGFSSKSTTMTPSGVKMSLDTFGIIKSFGQATHQWTIHVWAGIINHTLRMASETCPTQGTLAARKTYHGPWVIFQGLGANGTVLGWWVR